MRRFVRRKGCRRLAPGPWMPHYIGGGITMTGLIVTWIADSLAIYAVGYLLRGVDVASLRDAFIAGALLSLINMLVKPVVVILTLPLTIVTLGLFYFVVSAFCLWLASEFVPGFMLHGFFTTVFAAILVSIFSSMVHQVLTNATNRRGNSR
jgi:putative membrane protein